MNKDVDVGFREAVRNQQPALALQYLVSIIEHQNETIAKLESRLNEPSPVVVDQVSPSKTAAKPQKNKTEPTE